MKRIYLTSAALLLFLVVGFYYFTATRSAAVINDDAALSPAFIQGSQNDDIVIPPPADNTVTTQQPAPTITKRPARLRRLRAKGSSQAVEGTQDVPRNVTFADYVADEPVAGESNKDFYGNNPAVQAKKVVRIRHGAVKDAHNCRLCKIFNGRFGPEIGYNQNTITNSSAANIHTGGINAGLMFNFPLGDNAAFQPGLRYITKGVRNMSTIDVNTNEKLTLHYLELPADLVYKIGNPDNARIMIGAGPYVSYLLSARDRYSNSDGGFVDVIGARPAYDPSNITRLDFGLGGFVGCETPEGIYAKVGAEIGLRGIQANSASEAMHNFNLLLTMGYMLGGTHK